MKSVITGLFICVVTLCYSQSQEKKFSNQYEEFQHYAQPNPDNELSKHFKKYLDADYLEAIDFLQKDEALKKVNLTFAFNDQNKIIRISANSRYPALNKKLKEVFKKFPVRKLNFSSKNTNTLYTLQIISKENNKTIVNCSSKLVFETYPSIKECESSKSYFKKKKCFERKLEEFILNQISLQIIQQSGLTGDLKLYPRFEIDRNGSVCKTYSKGPTKELTDELNRTLMNLPPFLVNGSRNGNFSPFIRTAPIKLIVDNQNQKELKGVEIAEDDRYNKIAKPNYDNEISKHFKKYLSTDLVALADLSKNKKRIHINFYFDKKNKIKNISTNTKVVRLNTALIEIFRKFPIENMNILEIDQKYNYSIQVIVKEDNNYVIKCNTVVVNEFPPIYKGCEKSKRFIDARNCITKNITKYVRENFKTDIASNIELTGDIRIFCMFTIDTSGNIIDVKARGPSPLLEREAIRILKLMPKFSKAGYVNKKHVTTKYSLPISLHIKTKEDLRKEKFERENERWRKENRNNF